MMLDSGGNPMTMGSRLADDPRFGPMTHLLYLGNQLHQASLSLLDSSAQTLNANNFSGLASGITWVTTGPFFQSNLDTGLAANDTVNGTWDGSTGILSGELYQSAERFSIRKYLDDGDVSNDFWSGTDITVSSLDGSFAAGTQWRFSTDGQLVSPDPFLIPEPSRALLLLLGLVPLTLRRRRYLR
jgi:hypothetical protein